jgi:hypothetical protein
MASATWAAGGNSLAEANTPVLAFNRGKVSPKAIARVDVQRMAFSAEVQTNMVPRVLGSMMLRPGLQYLLPTNGNAAAKFIPFVFSTTDTALLEITASGVRVIVGDAAVTRASVATTFTNGTFDSDITGWTGADETGATSAFATGGYLSLVGTRFNAAIRRQEVTVAVAVRNVEHAVRFAIARGPVTIKIGSTSGGSDYVDETELGTGTYSLVFTPTGNFHVELAGREQAASLVDSVAVDGGGDFVLPAPWGAPDLDNIRWDQSGDVIFIACDGYQQRRLERFDTSSKSWGISLYEPGDGPFRNINVSTITLTPSALTGDITLTASRALFKPSHVGALFKVTSIGQQVSSALTAVDQFTDSIRVIGVGNSRIFKITISGTFTATLTLQRSIDEEGSWTDVTTFTTPQAAVNHDDGLDNQIAFYRLIVTAFTSQTNLVATLDYASGGLDGIARVTGYTSETVVDAAVLTAMGGTDTSRDWSEGSWSDFRGYPSSVAFYEGRLWWAGKGFFFGSVSDAFESFDEDFEGDAGPIVRSIASGPVDSINWLLPLQRLIAGTAGAEVSARSTSFDEPLTPSNFNLKDASTQGSTRVPAVKVDSNGVFVQRAGSRVFELTFSFDANDYAPADLTDIVPEIGEPAIVRVAIQRQPDTRLHFVRSDGTVALLIREPDNQVLCWLDIETDGTIEDVAILPGALEDAVYYVVRRTVGGGTARYLEKWAMENECVGGTLNRQADSFVSFTSGSPGSTVTGLSHLEGKPVVVWADGKCLDDAVGEIATFTVSGGAISLTDGGSAYAATTGIVGLAYRGRFKSTKLAYASQLGTALAQRKRLTHLGLILADTYPRALKYGPDFTVMDRMPLVDNAGGAVDPDAIWTEYEQDMFEWPGGWGVDERFCLEVNAPRPATCLGLVVGIDENDKA